MPKKKKQPKGRKFKFTNEHFYMIILGVLILFMAFTMSDMASGTNKVIDMLAAAQDQVANCTLLRLKW